MKRLCALCLAAVLFACLPACGGEDAVESPTDAVAAQPAKPAPYTVADGQALVDAGACDGVMEAVDAYIISLLYGIPEESITDCAGFLAINTSVSADEVTVLVLADEAAAIAAEEACRKRAADQITACKNYCPDQIPRLEDAVVLRRENTVLFAVGSPENLPKALSDLGLN